MLKETAGAALPEAEGGVSSVLVDWLGVPEGSAYFLTHVHSLSACLGSAGVSVVSVGSS